MTDISDAGEMVSGGMLAYAVEPKSGAADARPRDGACLNCGAALTGVYCAACGQPAHVHRTVGAIWHELVHGVLHADGKLWRTLPELAFRPGELTRRYIAGERAKFISPLALFLFSALLMYAVYSIFGGSGSGSAQYSARETAEELREEVEKLDTRIGSVETELRSGAISAERRARLQARLVDLRDDRAELAAASAITDDVGQGASAGRSAAQRFETEREFISYRLKANAYKFSWALILISTPMVWLLFAWKRRYGLYDHATFVTYSIAFMSLLFSLWTALSALGMAASGIVMLLLMLYALWHMYAQMKGAYGLTRTGALMRLPLLYGIAAVSAGMFYGLITATA
jgi:ABC-type multidrug transport system fused ATPase/permease subunit